MSMEWRRQASPKRRLTFSGIRGVISQKVWLLITKPQILQWNMSLPHKLPEQLSLSFHTCNRWGILSKRDSHPVWYWSILFNYFTPALDILILHILVNSIKGEWPPLWSSGYSSWLQTQRSGFHSWRYQIFWEVVGQERGPLSLVSTIEELLGRKSSDSGLENREYGRRDPPQWPHDTLCPQKLAQA
jgi:hypothetical protein